MPMAGKEGITTLKTQDFLKSYKKNAVCEITLECRAGKAGTKEFPRNIGTPYFRLFLSMALST